jgi:adenylosuccinate lyase
MEELPFIVTETIIMRLVSLGKSKEVAHEEIRVLPYQASDVVKKDGGKNDLMRIKRTEDFFTG